jgi:large-conductance mechanosensitive channel
MITSIVDILVGFIIGWIENSNQFRNIVNKLYNEFSKRQTKKIKNSDDTLESFYRELYQSRKMQYYAMIDTLIIYSIILFIIIGVITTILNLFTSPLKIGNIIIPQWGLFAIGYTIYIVYSIIKAKIKSKITYSNFL